MLPEEKRKRRRKGKKKKIETHLYMPTPVCLRLH